MQARVHVADLDLPLALRSGLRTPLRALRAALEELAAGRTDAESVLPGAIETLARALKQVDALSDWLAPGEPQPLRCTAREIAYGALDLLGRARGQIVLACEGPPVALFVDPALVAKSIARLVELELARGADTVLLHLCSDGESCSFAIVGRPRRDVPNEDGELALAATARDLARAGVACEWGRCADSPEPARTELCFLECHTGAEVA